MAEYSMLEKISQTVRSWIDTIQGKPKPEHPLIRYGTPILFAAFALAALSAVYVGYRWYAQGREQKAQYACSELLDEYLRLQAEQTPDYSGFVAKAQTVYAYHKRSAVAPYIGLLVVDAELKRGNHPAAVAMMDTVSAAADNNDIVGDLFKTKQALLKIDSADQVQQEEGFKQLALLADNGDNPHRDYALYQLGLYHWNKNDLQAARTAWQELVESQEVELRAPSPWADVVAEKLATIPAPAFGTPTTLETV
jgi:hypothetical protein